MTLNNYHNHANVVIQWLEEPPVDKDLLLDATKNYQAYQLLDLDWEDRNVVLDNMPEELWWYIKENRWGKSPDYDLIDLLIHHYRRIPAAMLASIYRELIIRIPNMAEEEANRLSKHLSERVERYTTKARYYDDLPWVEVGLKGRAVYESMDGRRKVLEGLRDLTTSVQYYVYYAYSHFPNFEFIDSLLYSTYDGYNWYDNETECNHKVHTFLIFLSRVSKECKGRIRSSLKTICEKNETMWRNSTFFDDHSGSFKALELIEYEITEDIGDGPKGIGILRNWLEVQKRIDTAYQEHLNL